MVYDLIQWPLVVRENGLHDVNDDDSSYYYYNEIVNFANLTPLPSDPKIGVLVKKVNLIWDELLELTKLAYGNVEAGKLQFFTIFFMS